MATMASYLAAALLITVAFSFSHALRWTYSSPKILLPNVALGNKYSHNAKPKPQPEPENSSDYDESMTIRFDDDILTPKTTPPADIEIVVDNYVSEWDPGHQPFWFLNKDKLDDYRNGLKSETLGSKKSSFISG